VVLGTVVELVVRLALPPPQPALTSSRAREIAARRTRRGVPCRSRRTRIERMLAAEHERFLKTL
jgi:hypothetical protein